MAYKILGDIDFEIYEEKPKQKKAIILFLSSAGCSNLLKIELNKLKKSSFIEEIIDKVQESQVMKSWRMPLEGIKYHLPKLEKIIVITSPESSKQFEFFEELVKTFIGKYNPGKIIEIEEIKAENFNSVKKFLKK